MIISILGSKHQKSSPALLSSLLDTIFASPSPHRIRVDEAFADYLRSQQIDVPTELIDDVYHFPHTDLLLSIGGDGTFLRAAKLIAGTEGMILGVNTGRLGFLANMLPDEVRQEWQSILGGEYESEYRDMVKVRTHGVKSVEISALNEIAILKRDTASMIGVETIVNGSYLATFEGDGVIIATPTGSTAYALSVNGPIIHPQSPTLSICPIAPHMLNMRPIVIPNDVSIEMKVSTRNDTFLLSTDGASLPLHGKTRISISKSTKRLRMLRHPSHSFFYTLRHKLMWGQDARSIRLNALLEESS